MIYIDKKNKNPLYQQVYAQIVKEIMDGSLKEGEVLQGSRSLAATLQVSRNTVDNAYNQLVAEGYIQAKKGIGYEVLQVPKLKTRKKDKLVKLELIEKQENQDIIYDLTNGSHTSDLFPKILWKKYTLECMENLERENRLSVLQDKQGEVYLRKNLLSYLERIRGVHCSEGQIIITSGIQQSLDYICKMIEKNKLVLIEEPGYHKAAVVFQNASMDLMPALVDGNGLVVDMLPNDRKADAIYTTPSHQFPTGVSMPIGRRYQLIEWADKNNTYILEDDFDSEQRYYAKPIPSLQSIDEKNRVIYLGTFSKALAPTLRMGYMILPPELLDIFHQKFENYNSTVPVINQYVVGRLLESGQYDRHIRRLTQIFKKRLELFEAELANMSDKIKISGNGTGQYFLLKFPEEINQEDLIKRAEKEGVRVYSTMQFWRDKAECPPNTIFLGFSKINADSIPDCVSRLKKAWKDIL